MNGSAAFGHAGSRESDVAAAGVSARWLASAVVGLFALDNLLLPAFLGVPVGLAVLAAAAATTAFAVLFARAGHLDMRIPLPRIAMLFAVATALFALGGEGRFFYANPDWQVRDAVLADLAGKPWPFVYDIDGWRAMLRAPLGLYLLPSLAGAQWAHLAMLAANAARLAILLSLAGALLPSRQARAIALGVFLLFSGMDAAGGATVAWMGQEVAWDHLEPWLPGSQYSATLTLAFWVPNHAIAGWTLALAYLLWLRRLAPVGLFAAAIPLVALWSPLAAMGALPFAAHAAVRALRESDWNAADLAMAALATIVALPALWYLRLDPGAVPAGVWPMTLMSMALLVVFEVAPLVWPLFKFKAMRPGDRAMLAIALACLLAMPVIRIGFINDFQMRASIMPLALVAFAFAEWIADLVAARNRRLLALGLGVLAIGAVTPAMELRRAVANGPSPPPLCSLASVWHQQTWTSPPYGTYLAARDALPRWLSDAPVAAGRGDPPRCWDRPWTPINGA